MADSEPKPNATQRPRRRLLLAAAALTASGMLTVCGSPVYANPKGPLYEDARFDAPIDGGGDAAVQDGAATDAATRDAGASADATGDAGGR